MAAATPILIANQDRYLNSTLIQITHIHPNNAHRVRSDVDVEELVIDNYPLELAKSFACIAVFLQPQQTVSLKRKLFRSPLRRADSAPAPDTITLVPPAKLLKVSTSLRGVDATPSKATPERQLLPPVKLDPVDTARTTTPGGNEFSPLKYDANTQSPRSPLALLKHTNSMPIALFSPPRAPPGRGRGRGRRRGGATGVVRNPSNPPPLVQLDTRPRSVEGSNPKMTLVLRHDLSLQGLKDFFEWCLRSVRILRMEHLDRWLINFHDWARVEQIKEVCITLHCDWMAKYCDRMLDRWRAQIMYDRSKRMSIQALLT